MNNLFRYLILNCPFGIYTYNGIVYMSHGVYYGVLWNDCVKRHGYTGMDESRVDQYLHKLTGCDKMCLMDSIDRCTVYTWGLDKDGKWYYI